jgi:integrase
MTATEGESPTVKVWLSRIAPSTAQTYAHHFRNWLKWMGENGGEFAGKSPDELVAFQKNAAKDDAYRILDLTQAWVLEGNGLRRGTKGNMIGAVKSFFEHNRAGLPRDKSFRLRSETPMVPNLLTVEEIRRAVLASNQTFRAAYMAMLAGGLDQESTVYWSDNGWPNLKEQLAAGKDPVKIAIPGRKATKNVTEFSTYITGDALDALKTHARQRGNEDGPIFRNQFGDPIAKTALAKYWLRRLKELGIIRRGDGKVQRYGRGLHNLRDTFRTLWAESGAKPHIAEAMMGHAAKADPYGYDQSFKNEEYVKEQLGIAVPFLNILTRGEAYGQVDRDEVAALKRRIAELEAAAATAQTKADEQDEIYREMMKDLIRDAFEERDRLAAEKEGARR